MDEQGRPFDIHHIDGDHFNDAIENLMALSIWDHYMVHKRQGDYGACMAIGLRMEGGLTHEERSRLAKELALERLADGTHHFLDKEAARERAFRQIAEGTNKFADMNWQKEKALKQLAEGKNPWVGGEQQKRLCKQRYDDKTHNFLSFIGSFWWTNGEIETRAKECPGNGFIRGRLKAVVD